MNKVALIIISLILAMAVGLVGCTTISPPPPVPEAPAPPAPAPEAPEAPPPPLGAISWDEAKYHIGERTTVYGPVVDTHWASGSKGKPTFLNIGKPYPDPDRFTVVIWIDYRANFPQAPEVYYLGKTIYVTGLIDEYPKGSGSAQIEVKDPSQIQEQ